MHYAARRMLCPAMLIECRAARAMHCQITALSMSSAWFTIPWAWPEDWHTRRQSAFCTLPFSHPVLCPVPHSEPQPVIHSVPAPYPVKSSLLSYMYHPVLHKPFTHLCTTLCFTNSSLIFVPPCASQTVPHPQAVTLPSMEVERTLGRSQLPVRALSFSPEGGMMAMAGDAENIRLVQTRDGTVRVQALCGASVRQRWRGVCAENAWSVCDRDDACESDGTLDWMGRSRAGAACSWAA